MDVRKTAKKWLGLNWQISANSGWGILGLNLAIEAEKDGRLAAVPLLPTNHAEYLLQQYGDLLPPILAREKVACELLGKNSAGTVSCEFPVVHSLGNWLGWPGVDESLDRIKGSPNLGIMFLEDTCVRPATVAASRKFDLLLAGSSWNERILRQNQILNVKTFLQGVDLKLFRPERMPRAAGKPFVIFSGGKLEYRKGQDIVVAAFRKFRQRHSDVVLYTAWQNPWPKTVVGIDRKGYVNGIPAATAEGSLNIVGWLEANDLPRKACHDCGPVPNHLMPRAYSQADVAVLTNRCEGGTNLVAMECLACGVPTILSANTGHLDLIDERHCYPLMRQSQVAPFPPFFGTDDWGESDVDEVVEALERVYRDRADAEKRAAAAVQFMQQWSWQKRFQELIRHLGMGV